VWNNERRINGFLLEIQRWLFNVFPFARFATAYNLDELHEVRHSPALQPPWARKIALPAPARAQSRGLVRSGWLGV
jgi:hypothetical protein